MTNPTVLKSQLKSRISAALGVSALALVLGLAACNQPASTGGTEATPPATEPAPDASAPAPDAGTSMDSGTAAPDATAPAPDAGGMTPAPDSGAPPAEGAPQ